MARALTLCALLWLWAGPALASPYAHFAAAVAQLEAEHGGRLGVALLRTRDGTLYSHRGEERFAFCSTFKVLAVGDVLRRSQSDPALLDKRLTVDASQIMPYSFAIKKYLNKGITLREVAKECMVVSDNTAANLLIDELGGPQAVTRFARSIGDTAFRLDRREMDMNNAVPGDERDTTTPISMAKSLHALLLGDALGEQERAQLQQWMRNCMTGYNRLRAGTPKSWTVADKTGTGDYGVTNALGVLWPPVGTPLVLVVFYAEDKDKEAPANNELVAQIARLTTQPERIPLPQTLVKPLAKPLAEPVSGLVSGPLSSPDQNP